MKQILIVEDLRIIAVDIKRKLEKLGYEVVGILEKGEDAIRFVNREPVDLILMDISLKGNMDGIAAATVIQGAFDVPTVYLTAHTDDGTVQRSKKANPYGFVSKPFTQNDLRIALEMAQVRRRKDEIKGIDYQRQFIKSLIKTLNMKNTREEKHSERVSMLCWKIGIEYDLDAESLKELVTSAHLHDLGKITIDERILNKEGKLTR